MEVGSTKGDLSCSHMSLNAFMVSVSGDMITLDPSISNLIIRSWFGSVRTCDSNVVHNYHRHITNIV